VFADGLCTREAPASQKVNDYGSEPEARQSASQSSAMPGRHALLGSRAVLAVPHAQRAFRTVILD
jgi:hypothetical protein